MSWKLSEGFVINDFKLALGIIVGNAFVRLGADWWQIYFCDIFAAPSHRDAFRKLNLSVEGTSVDQFTTKRYIKAIIPKICGIGDWKCQHRFIHNTLHDRFAHWTNEIQSSIICVCRHRLLLEVQICFVVINLDCWLYIKSDLETFEETKYSTKNVKLMSRVAIRRTWIWHCLDTGLGVLHCHDQVKFMFQGSQICPSISCCLLYKSNKILRIQIHFDRQGTRSDGLVAVSPNRVLR